MFQKAPEMIWALILGGIILGIPIAVAGYYIAYTAVVRYQRDIKRKIAARKEMRARKRRERRLRHKEAITDQEPLH